MEIEQVEKFEDGDVFSCGSGEHIGSVNIDGLLTIKKALHLQIYLNGEWYVYQLVGIEKLGEESDAKSA